MQGWFNICKKTNVIHHINKKKKGQEPYDPLNRCRESIWQNTASFLDKDPQESRDRRSIPQDHKSHIWITHANIILNGEKLTAFPLRSGTQQGCVLLLLLFNTVLEVQASTIKQQKEIKGIQIGKEEVKHSLFTDTWYTLYGKPKNSTKKLLELVHEFSKVAGYTIMYRNLCHFYTPIMKQQKEKSRNWSHLQLHQQPWDT